MTAAQHRCDVVHLINARREKITADNSVFAPLVKDPDRQRELAEAAPFWTDENAPVVNLDPPPQWAARRRQMRRDGLHVIAGMIGLVALIGFALTPDSAAVKSMMEASQ